MAKPPPQSFEQSSVEMAVPLSHTLEPDDGDEDRVVSKRTEAAFHLETVLAKNRPPISMFVHYRLWQALLVGVLIVDTMLLLVKLGFCASGSCEWQQDIYLTSVSSITLVYLLDVLLRLMNFGTKAYFCHMLHLFEFLALVSGVLLVGLIAGDQFQLSWTAELRVYQEPLWSLHMLRWFRWLHIGRSCTGCSAPAGYMSLRKRRRYQDLSEDYDLDLTYITPRLIAMSGPTDKWLDSLVRNCVWDVARYLEHFYPNRYLVVNCCPENHYDQTPFVNGEVLNLDVQDLTPPTMRQLLGFVKAVVQFMEKDEENVVVVHCKEGRGRAATLAVSLLLGLGDSHSVEDALAEYCILRVGENSMRSVETPSQLRYLTQLASLLSEAAHTMLISTMVTQVSGMPSSKFVAYTLEAPANRVSLSSIRLQNMWADEFIPPNHLVACIHEVQDGSHLRLVARSQVVLAKSHIFQELTFNTNVVGEDVRLTVFNADQAEQPADIPRKGELEDEFRKPLYPAGAEPGCLLYFYFHCHFLSADGVLEVQVGRDAQNVGVDKACRSVHQFNQKGQVIVKYGPAA